VRRWVLDLGGANDELGHGVTTLDLDGGAITFSPGPNEDFIVVREGEPGPTELDPKHWTEVALERLVPRGPLDRVDLLTDGVDDVAVLLRFRSGDELVIALVDTDLVLARDLSVLDGHSTLKTRLREGLTGPAPQPGPNRPDP
jgi:hypothetical protein